MPSRPKLTQCISVHRSITPQRRIDEIRFWIGLSVLGKPHVTLDRSEKRGNEVPTCSVGRRWQRYLRLASVSKAEVQDGWGDKCRDITKQNTTPSKTHSDNKEYQV